MAAAEGMARTAGPTPRGRARDGARDAVPKRFYDEAGSTERDGVFSA